MVAVVTWFTSGAAVFAAAALLALEIQEYKRRVAEIRRDSQWQTMFHERVWEDDNDGSR